MHARPASPPHRYLPVFTADEALFLSRHNNNFDIIEKPWDTAHEPGGTSGEAAAALTGYSEVVVDVRRRIAASGQLNLVSPRAFVRERISG